MTPHSARLCILASSLALPLLLSAGRAAAQDPSDAAHDAGKHFQRAVSLYGETDYRAALVEFKRAYAIAPNVSVLYNVGETQYQLQDYAGALSTFTRYLAESNANEAHRAEVEGTLEVLRSRVGHVSVVTDPPGADITVDDLSVGRTPLEERVLVSVGHRRFTASMLGRVSVTRFVDVAAEDNVSLKLDLPASPDVPPEVSALPPPAEESRSASHGGASLRIAGWIGTGVLAASAGTLGLLALNESSALKKARESYPASADTLHRDSNLTTTYSIMADSLTVAAVVLGGVTLYATVASAASHRKETTSRVWLGPGSAHFEMKF
jgi:hypothetical protein